jgi:hypothetical protein
VTSSPVVPPPSVPSSADSSPRGALRLPSTGLGRGSAGWLPCSDRSRERNDPLAGTGSHGSQWFLVEISGAWGQHAFLESPLDPVIGRTLVKRIEAAGMRPLAIRRTGRREPQDGWRWAVVDSRPGQESVSWGHVERAEELLEVPLDGSAGQPSHLPILAVCAHARHDQCCAVRGRKVVAELADAFPEETWECSHLGGDRFAGTMVLLPHGLYYGRMDDGDAVGIVERYLDGRVDERFFRGRSALPNAVQAAQHYAREYLDDDRLDILGPLSADFGDGIWRIVLEHRGLEHSGTSVTVALAETLSEPLLSTCSATRAVQVREYRLLSVS